MADVRWYWRMLIPVAQLVGLAPCVAKLSRETLVAMMTRVGFTIDHEWRQGEMAVFLVVRKVS